ncbi:hypothetical protein BASA81_017110 [Batrachochytrium salamandrivorans]|nr:hypothetical protein BASA81_017110 [Batrachochytrium salamandrivorans]
MRDIHTLYHKAGPYGCFSVSTGLLFNFVDDSLGSSAPSKVRVIGITNNPEIRSLIGRSLSSISAGDELLTVNGVSFDDWYEQNKFILGFGANDSGGHSRAFRYLSGIEGDYNILPEADGITLQLKRVGISQAVYTVTVPYVALSNDECWNLSSNLYKELTGIALPEMPTPRSFRYKRSAVGNGVSLPGNNTLQKGDTDIHKRSYWESVNFEDMGIEGWSWTIWKKIFWLTSSRIPTQFLFDVRGNTGGLISAADGIIQLLKPDFTSSQFRYLKNEVTKDLFYKGVTSKSPWSKAWSATSYSSRYSGLGSAYDSSVSNTFGQAYFNPVGVYTDGMCYSACEVFAAQIQDHKIGTVFGEDETTGGGGANVFSSYDDYFTDRPLQYIADPFKANLTGKNPGHKFHTRVSVSVRQLVRGGNYAERGVSTYDRISEYLSDVAKKQADKNVYFEYEPHSQYVADDSMDVTVVASGVDEIIVVSQGKQLGEWRELSRVPSRQDYKITVKTPTGLRDHMITFIGKKQGTQVFKTHQRIH